MKCAKDCFSITPLGVCLGHMCDGRSGVEVRDWVYLSARKADAQGWWSSGPPPSTHAGAEKFIRFQCPLGLSQTQTMRFIHFAKVNADFACKFVEPKPTVFTKTNNQYVIRCTPAAPEGTEVCCAQQFCWQSTCLSGCNVDSCHPTRQHSSTGGCRGLSIKWQPTSHTQLFVNPP